MQADEHRLNGVISLYKPVERMQYRTRYSSRACLCVFWPIGAEHEWVHVECLCVRGRLLISMADPVAGQDGPVCALDAEAAQAQSRGASNIVENVGAMALRARPHGDDVLVDNVSAAHISSELNRRYARRGESPSKAKGRD